MSGKNHRGLHADHIQKIEAFVVRARRVEQHSLVKDSAFLVELAQVTMRAEYNQTTGEVFLLQKVPPEEQAESLAARVRPFILESSPIHYSKVIGALGYLLRDHSTPELKKILDDFRAEWKGLRAGATSRAYNVYKGDEQLSDNELAFAWVYGDVIHADQDKLRRTSDFGIEERYRAGVHLVARIALLAIATLNLIRRLRSTKHLPLSDSVFSGDVVVEETELRFKGEVYTAPPGTPLPPFDQVSEEWIPFDRQYIDSLLQPEAEDSE